MQLYTDKEYNLIKNTFTEETLSDLRKYLLKQPVESVVMNDEVKSILRKVLNLEFNIDIELSQIINPFSGIDYDKDDHKIVNQLKARQLALEFMRDRVEGKEGSDLMDLKITDDDRETAINAQARQTVLDTVQLCINKLNYISQQEEETWEQLEARLKKDSSK